MKEYIMPIDDTAFDWDEMFVGVIRKQEELIRCKDCKHHCYVNKIPYCNLIDYGYGWKDDDFCSCAERKDNETD